MSQAPTPPDTTSQRTVLGRDTAATADARCACYAVLSELVASPHDLDPRESLRDRMGTLNGIAYAEPIEALLPRFVDRDLDALKREYSGLFEVGSDGPPVPIREDLQTGQRAGTREDLVRFYSYFNYTLSEKFAWAPDHLSVELEFMHFLCYREATADSDKRSYQLAQADFAERHLVRWVPRLVAAVAAASPDAFYNHVLGATGDFIATDLDWQRSTIATNEDANG